MKGYIGSVRFFKNLILLVVIIAILIPSGAAFRYRGENRELTQQLQQAQEEMSHTFSGVSALTAELVAAGDAPAYQALYPDFYVSEHGGLVEDGEKTAYLTFDDGPSERTDEVLDILKEEGVRATFFVVGREDEESLRRLRRIADEGHCLAMHTYSHEYKDIYASVEAYLADMYRLFTLIRDTTGQTPTVFRMPGGSLNAYNYHIYQELLSEMLRRGFVPCDWNVTAGDSGGTELTAQDLTDNVAGVTGEMDRCFILLHDDGEKTATVAALKDIIATLHRQGFALEAMTPRTRPVLFGYRK